MANPGDKVTVVTREKEFEGILMPNEGTNSIVVKLDNGYNVGIERGKVKELNVLEKAKEPTETKKEVKQKDGLLKISILHTGGTIASKVDYRTGAVYTSFKPEDLLGMFPELADIANFESTLISNMWSDDLRFRHFEIIAEAIEKEIKKGAEGIIIGIGTDNLAVASAALAFMFEGLPIPVILVGAQRSSDRGSSDAGMNLICAAEFIARTDFSGVAICMHENSDDNTCAILPACKTRKLHSSRRDAFRPVNTDIIARVDYEKKNIDFIKKDYHKKGKQKLEMKTKMEERVGLLKVHINMFPQQFEFFKGYKGLVIEGTGLGHTPGHVPNDDAKIHEKIFPAIKKVIDSGCVVVMTTQCIYGRVHMHVYDKGTDLIKLGVISGEDMLAETALVKLSWLLGNYPPEDAKKLVSKNMRGEISERTPPRNIAE